MPARELRTIAILCNKGTFITDQKKEKKLLNQDTSTIVVQI
jgi:hypothetical protein